MKHVGTFWLTRSTSDVKSESAPSGAAVTDEVNIKLLDFKWNNTHDSRLWLFAPTGNQIQLLQRRLSLCFVLYLDILLLFDASVSDRGLRTLSNRLTGINRPVIHPQHRLAWSVTGAFRGTLTQKAAWCSTAASSPDFTHLRDIGTASLNVLHDEAAHTHTRIFLLHQKLSATSSQTAYCTMEGKKGRPSHGEEEDTTNGGKKRRRRRWSINN